MGVIIKKQLIKVMVIQRISKSKSFNKEFQNPKDSLILNVMEKEFGHAAAHAIISHVARTTIKSKAEILSDYDTFSRILKQVYPDGVAEKEILDRLSSYGFREKII